MTKGDSAWRLSTEEAEQRFHFAVSRSMWVNGRKSVEANEWHHVLGVYDGEQIRTYVDGEFDASMQWNGRIESNDYPVYIGENAEQTGRYWNGLIDDVRVYSYALSDEEIGKLCRAKAMKPKPSDGAVVNPAVKVELSWDPAVGTHSHKVYLGLSKGDLRLAGETKESIFTTLPNLQKDKKYSWRVDGILNNGSVAKGDVWSFSAGKLVGWWKFDESSGSIAGDSSGNGNNGTLQGDVAWQPKAGKFAGALKFDGTSSYVEIPTEGMSALMGTVSLWVKLSPQQKEPEHRYIFGHTTTPYYSNRIQLYMDESLTMLDLGLCNSHNLNTTMATLEVETWYQIALAWNEGVYVVYLNGEELASGGYNNLEGLSDIADIGNNGRPNSRNQSFNGLIDDVRIYNYALSKNGIKTLYNESK